MKRQRRGRLREVDGRSLSSYARRGKTPFRYGERPRVDCAPEGQWRPPRGAKPFRTAPRSK